MASDREAKAMEAATDALSGRLAELKSSAGRHYILFENDYYNIFLFPNRLGLFH